MDSTTDTPVPSRRCQGPTRRHVVVMSFSRYKRVDGGFLHRLLLSANVLHLFASMKLSQKEKISANEDATVIVTPAGPKRATFKNV